MQSIEKLLQSQRSRLREFMPGTGPHHALLKEIHDLESLLSTPRTTARPAKRFRNILPNSPPVACDAAGSSKGRPTGTNTESAFQGLKSPAASRLPDDEVYIPPNSDEDDEAMTTKLWSQDLMDTQPRTEPSVHVEPGDFRTTSAPVVVDGLVSAFYGPDGQLRPWETTKKSLAQHHKPINFTEWMGDIGREETEGNLNGATAKQLRRVVATLAQADVSRAHTRPKSGSSENIGGLEERLAPYFERTNSSKLGSRLVEGCDLLSLLSKSWLRVPSSHIGLHQIDYAIEDVLAMMFPNKLHRGLLTTGSSTIYKIVGSEYTEAFFDGFEKILAVPSAEVELLRALRSHIKDRIDSVVRRWRRSVQSRSQGYEKLDFPEGYGTADDLPIRPTKQIALQLRALGIKIVPAPNSAVLPSPNDHEAIFE
ncbi:unnamed protein product, partial [Mesorhabditis spiculigera]